MAAATNFVEIGTQFVQHYYQTFDSNRSGLQPPLRRYVNAQLGGRAGPRCAWESFQGGLCTVMAWYSGRAYVGCVLPPNVLR